MKKAWKIIIAVVAMAILILCFAPITYPLKKTVTATEIRHNDPNHIIQREIRIDGQYSFYLFKNDKFKGSFEIEGYEETKGRETFEIQLSNDTFPLYYLDEEYMIVSFATILASRNFEEFFIGVMENDRWGGDDGLSLFAPAPTKDEAKAVWESLSLRNEWVAASDWPE